MATRSTEIKRLNPRSADNKYLGDEPEWTVTPTAEDRVGRLSRAFNWYNYYYGKKDAKDMLAHYLDHVGRAPEAKIMRGVADNQIQTTTAWICRMTLLGLVLDPQELALINQQISAMLATKQEAKKSAEEVKNDTAATKLTIQDHLRERVSQCMGELEGMFDDFIQDGAKLGAKHSPMALMRRMNVSPNMIGIIREVWESHMAEFVETMEGRDRDLVEGYGHLTKQQLKSLIRFCEAVINDCNSYVQLKKVERKPRTKKPVSPEKLTRSFKYLKEFSELELRSEPVTKLVGASEAWMYDTVKRKLIHVVADSHAGSLSVKGSSVIGFDPLQTLQKTLRKPAEQLRYMISAGAPAARKFFKEIKSTEIKWNGRGNENLVILRAR